MKLSEKQILGLVIHCIEESRLEDTLPIRMALRWMYFEGVKESELDTSSNKRIGCGKVLATGKIFSDVYNLDDDLNCGDVWCGKQHLCPECRSSTDYVEKSNDGK